MLEKGKKYISVADGKELLKEIYWEKKCKQDGEKFVERKTGMYGICSNLKSGTFGQNLDVVLASRLCFTPTNQLLAFSGPLLLISILHGGLIYDRPLSTSASWYFLYFCFNILYFCIFFFGAAACPLDIVHTSWWPHIIDQVSTSSLSPAVCREVLG